jgi:hypothetical protein
LEYKIPIQFWTQRRFRSMRRRHLSPITFQIARNPTDQTGSALL